MKDISLREYQENAITKIRDSHKSGNRKVILMLPTGAGKTRIAAKIIQMIVDNGKRVLFICDRIVLIDQAVKVFDGFGIPCGVVQANHDRTDSTKPLQVCSIQTLKNRRTPQADYIISDEVHAVYETQNKLMAEWDNVKYLGVSGTPFTKGLGLNWDDLVVGATTQELIDLGYLVHSIVYGAAKLNLSKVKTVMGDFNQTQLGKAVDKKLLIGEIVRNWQLRGGDKQTICFGVNILHIKHITAQFNAAGIKAMHLDCYTTTEERDEIYKDFTDKKIRVLCSVDILSRGFDEPQVACLIQARPTKSLMIHVQQCGRAIRICEGKDHAVILDHAGNTERLGFITDPLPTVLNHDIKADAVEPREKEDLPKTCSKCGFLKPPKVHECSQCGFKPEKINEIENTNDTLVKLDKVEISVKMEWYSMFLYYARSKGFQDGAASHMYKAKFQKWPHRKTGVTPIEPNTEVKKYIQYLNIKKAKSRR